MLSNISMMTFAQEKFVRYQDFEIAYSHNIDLNKISQQFNLLSLLLLDSSNQELFFEYDSTLKDRYKKYVYRLRSSDNAFGFIAHISKVDKIFTSNLLTNKFFDCISDTLTQDLSKQQISYPIYIKDNTAVVKVKRDNSINVYILRFHEGLAQIYWLEETTE